MPSLVIVQIRAQIALQYHANMRFRRAAIGLLLGTIFGQASAAVAETSTSARLGLIEFTVTALAPARDHFLRGMLAMHSFWYDTFWSIVYVSPFAFVHGMWSQHRENKARDEANYLAWCASRAKPVVLNRADRGGDTARGRP